jgi:small subunit ribosomal protein S1
LAKPSDEYTEEEYNQLMGMYENTLNEIEEKEIVTGRIISIDDKYVVIDIGFKSEGIVAVNEFNSKQLENMAPGDEVDVFLD